MTAAPPPVVALANVHKVYRTGTVEVHALRGVSLRIERGEFVALVGASGSGKSTLMNLLGLLDRATSGVYRFDGQDVSRYSKRALAHLRNRKLGFVFQGFNLLKRQTAVENVELPLVYAGVRLRQRTAGRALWNCSRWSVSPSAPSIAPVNFPAEQQRARRHCDALVNRPQVLLADEPTGNLDSATGADILAEFTRLNVEQGQTIVLVTHDKAIAACAKRRIAVKDGRIASDERS